jgi:hypothetical protein
MNSFRPYYLTHTNQLYGKFPKAYFATLGKSLWAYAILGAGNHF